MGRPAARGPGQGRLVSGYDTYMCHASARYGCAEPECSFHQDATQKAWRRCAVAVGCALREAGAASGNRSILSRGSSGGGMDARWCSRLDARRQEAQWEKIAMCGFVRIVGGLVVAACAASAMAQDVCPGDVIKLRAFDGAEGDSFGFSVAIDGDTAIVGAYLDDDRGFNTGSAYVFERVDGVWMLAAKLTADDRAASDEFGFSVAIDGDTAIVGAHQDDDLGSNSGSAYVFERVNGAWTQAAKLTADDGAEDDLFGRTVAISGDTAIVGAYQDDDLGSNSGSAYVFERIGNEWTQIAKLTALDGAAGDRFGSSVAIDGDTAVIGAHGDDDRGSNSGSAYIYQRFGGSWFFTQKLLPPDESADDQFGRAVAINGDTAVVGAQGDDDRGSNSGSAYVFQREGNAWTQAAKLTADDGTDDDFFGHSVTIDGDTAVVGANRDDDRGYDSGSAYVFEHIGNEWTQIAKLTAPDGSTFDSFGISVAISAETAIVGSSGDNDRGAGSGSAYIYPSIPSNDCCADIDRNGSLDAADFFLFLDLFAAGDSRADFTGEGVIDGGDFFAYLDLFAAGCP